MPVSLQTSAPPKQSNYPDDVPNPMMTRHFNMATQLTSKTCIASPTRLMRACKRAKHREGHRQLHRERHRERDGERRRDRHHERHCKHCERHRERHRERRKTCDTPSRETSRETREMHRERHWAGPLGGCKPPRRACRSQLPGPRSPKVPGWVGTGLAP